MKILVDSLSSLGFAFPSRYRLDNRASSWFNLKGQAFSVEYQNMLRKN